MNRKTLAVLAGSLCLGYVALLSMPPRWGFTPLDGLFLGPALYAAAWRRFLEARDVRSGPADGRSGGRGGTLPGLAWRAALFLALLLGIAHLCFDVLGQPDVRRGFVILSSWIVAQSLLDTGAPRGRTPGRPAEA